MFLFFFSNVHICYTCQCLCFYNFTVFNRIVGDDDGGKLMTPEEYEEYKKKVIPMVGRI